MDDVLDEWSTSLLKSQIKRPESPSMSKKKVSSCIPSPCICFKRVAGRRDIALKIKDIKQQVDDIANQSNRFNFTSRFSNEEPQRLITISAVDISEVWGRDRERDTILRQLLGKSCEQNLGPCTISVVGMGGIGKTTLAQLAFNHDDVKAHFDKRIWVCVSDPFVPIRILRAILEALQGQSSDLHDLEALQQKIQESIDGKKFLLVLDDVWTEDYQLWEQLKNCLQCGGGGSRILVTTRNESVARMMRSTYMHSLGSLLLEQCRALFSQIAFCGKSTDKIEELEEIGKKIADKCKGLPLAVKALGSLMQSKNNKEDWENVLNSEMWELDVFEKKLSPALFAFSYCAVFPKDHSIETDDLIKLWMAQSYLNCKAGREMEPVGREYFENLAARSFFQDFEKDEEGNIVRCKMNDILHDFAQFLTNNECLIVEDDCENLKTNLSRQKGRHATVIVNGSTRSSLSVNNARNLNTLLVVSNNGHRVDSFPLDSFQQFKYLRAMDWRSNDSIVELPREYLPETICGLCNLQTLDVRYCMWLQKRPQGMGNLVNLRHLLFFWGVSGLRSMPKGVGRLTSLRTLPHFFVSDVCKLEEMRNLNELRGELNIKGLGSVEDAGEAGKAELKNKKHLHHLTLNFGSEGRRVVGKKEVAEALQPPPNLKSLCMASYQVNEWPTWMMEASLLQLTHIDLLICTECYLKISDMLQVKYVGDEFFGSSSEIAFPRLKRLVFHYMPGWENWEVKEEGRKIMPCLLSLDITDCPKLTTLPKLLHQRTLPLQRLLA
ncbi:hypothetical protein PVL29_011836 [Vitis rotundifolia]|uniref:NB-ARC domain-containing protein n=1 Tax=Vitis rotundifolia TaxID=103349 RepID=A0AA38ZQ38_VITRO|nr:hypothetical protein PVL29_011836 [Vitis rotundifolia]